MAVNTFSTQSVNPVFVATLDGITLAACATKTPWICLKLYFVFICFVSIKITHTFDGKSTICPNRTIETSEVLIFRQVRFFTLKTC